MECNAAYIASPIDWDWDLSRTVDEIKVLMTERQTEDGQTPYGGLSAADLDDLLEAAKAQARRLGWEGDMVEGPVVFALPGADCHGFAVGLAWKQANNGTTFIFSPFALPWLEQYRVGPHDDIYNQIADLFLGDLSDYSEGASRERIIAVTKDFFKTERSARAVLRVMTKHIEERATAR